MVPSQSSLFPRPNALFATRALEQYLDEHRDSLVQSVESRQATVRDWVSALAERAARMTEPTLEQEFNRRILQDVLDYLAVPAANASLFPKPSQADTGSRFTPDVALGDFSADALFLAVVELKRPGTNLDEPQLRARAQTPVEQAFQAAESIVGVRWVVVSNMDEIRLYSVESRTDYVRFSLSELAKDPYDTSFRRFYFLLAHPFLILGGSDSAVSRLLAKSSERQVEIREGFYRTYHQIRGDLIRAIDEATTETLSRPNREEILEAAQRLLDRILFIRYCEDHPDRLISPETLRAVTDAARNLPGATKNRVYEALKALFIEVDQGSPSTSGLSLHAFNGELFKHHPIIDEISLPDSLHDKRYTIEGRRGTLREIKGVWGFHELDFWQELNEHLLGHIFEESLSDTVRSRRNREDELSEKLIERKRHGIYYTDQILSDFLASSVLDAVLEEQLRDESRLEELEAAAERIASLRIADFACGSGAFLVSVYRALTLRYEQLTQTRIAAEPGTQLGLESHLERLTRAQLLRDIVFGVDLLPQAVELAKLALWLRSARRDEKIADLSRNIIVGDSLSISEVFANLQLAPNSLDLVIGNPPWGATVEDETRRDACRILGLDEEHDWDSWELFLALALYALKDGGRLALVLPDTIFSPRKAESRRLLLEQTCVEKIYSLGPD